MKRNSVIYSYPFAVDIVVALLLFVGRHSLASRGLGEEAVGSILLCYGFGYSLSSLFMRKIVRVGHARWQMAAGLGAIVLACGLLARVQDVRIVQGLFCAIPFAISLFFNSFQAFMLDISNDAAKPLAATAGHYTFSWSMGFALGPFVSGVARSYFSWEQIYNLAALVAGIVGLLVFFFEPDRGGGDSRSSGRAVASGGREGKRSLIGPAWLGLMLGWIGWNAVSTYWPVQATLIGFSAAVKGSVEFAFALAQSLGALALVYLKGWHHRPFWMVLFGMTGAVALLVFGFSALPLSFVAGALLYGFFTGSLFSNMVYHSMYDPEKAVRRVSLNETLVGLSFLAGPLVASLCHRGGEPFGPVYLLLAGCLVVGILFQGVSVGVLNGRGEMRQLPARHWSVRR